LLGNFGDNRHSAGHGGLNRQTDKVVGLPPYSVELFAEGCIGKPAPEGPLGDAGFPGCLGHGSGDSDDRKGGLLPEG
jgi:hypothetical protein